MDVLWYPWPAFLPPGAACGPSTLMDNQRQILSLQASLLQRAIIPIAISEMPINLREIKNHYMKYREDTCR